MSEAIKKCWQEYAPDITRALPWLRGETVFRAALRRMVMLSTALSWGAQRLQRAHQLTDTEGNIFASIAAECGLRLRCEGKLPAGALVVVANHPTGPMDGVCMGAWLFSQRSDVRILTTDALAQIPCFRNVVIGLSLYDGIEAVGQNSRGLLQAYRHLRKGGCLAVFPGGTAAWRRRDGVVREADWSDAMFQLAERSHAALGVISINAKNPPWLALLMSMHSFVRTLLMGWSFFFARQTEHRIRWRGVIARDASESMAQWVKRCERISSSMRD
jgi:putative hemolysin